MPQSYIRRCTPSLGMVSIEWANRTEQLLWPHCTGRSCGIVRDTVGNEIAEQRNALVAQTLALNGADVPFIFWLDDDVMIQRGALLQLYNSSQRGTFKPIIAGVYFSKEDCAMGLGHGVQGATNAGLSAAGNISQALIFKHEGWSPAQYEGGGEPFPVFMVPMGLTLVATEVYRKILKDLKPDMDKYGHPQFYRTLGRTDNLEPGQSEIEDRGNNNLFTGCTEDAFFCELARKVGYQCWIDPHEYAFGWHFDKMTWTCAPRKQWEQSRAGKAIEWDTPKGKVVWE